MANFMHLSTGLSTSISSVGKCMMGRTWAVMRWYMLLSRLGIRKLGVILANYLLLFFFRGLAFTIKHWHLSWVPRGTCLLWLSIIFRSFALCGLSWRCARQYACRRSCQERTQHFKLKAYMMCSFQYWCRIDVNFWRMYMHDHRTYILIMCHLIEWLTYIFYFVDIVTYINDPCLLMFHAGRYMIMLFPLKAFEKYSI